MAISHVHLTLLLLFSLFWLPTLLAIPFKDCDFESSPVKVTSVEILQNKTMASFQISGSTSKIISNGFMEVYVRAGMLPILSKTYNLCDYITCPLAPGAFVLISDKIFHSQIKYRVAVKIFEESDYDVEIVCLAFEFQTERSVMASA